MKSNKEYFDTYFAICEFLFQKKGLLYQLWEDDRKGISGDKEYKLRQEMTMIDELVRSEDWGFWEEVRDAAKWGCQFALEDLAIEYHLDPFEKRVTLFMLFLDLYHSKHNTCGTGELIALMDFENSWSFRMGAHRHFTPDAPLLKEDILTRRDTSSWDSEKPVFSLSLSARDKLTAYISQEPAGSPGVKAPSLEPCPIGDVRDPEYRMEDVVLTEDVKEKVYFTLQGMNGGLDKFGVNEKIKKGRGAVFLFYGPPGTGKSMLAEAVAHEVGKKLLVAEVSRITSRWFGDTEKAIVEVFRYASKHDLVVCIDEADSFFQDRRNMSHERDVLFTNVMLQEVERFAGVVVLTTNIEQRLDPALERRISLRVKLSPPDEALRSNIWRSLIPGKVKVANDVDFAALGRRYDLSGGYIKNAILHALKRLIQEDRLEMRMADLVFGAELEENGMFLSAKRKQIGFASNEQEYR